MRDLERYQSDYASLPFEQTQAAFRRRRIIEHLERFRPARILEVGCGEEPLFLHYQACEALHVVEPAARFHEHAEQLARGRAGVQVHLGTLEALAGSLASVGFDCIVLGSVLHEAQDPAALLNAVHTLCGASTTVHVYVPNARSLHRLLALEMGLIADIHEVSATQQRMQQSVTYDAELLTKALRKAGFTVEETGSFFIKPFTHAQMAGLQAGGMLDARMLEGLYGLGRHLPEHGSELYAIARARGN
jgi:2-polyprenyl-3-methyl-5-hydroxy-6-metoxy-1,4-benzoquinol methylase